MTKYYQRDTMKVKIEKNLKTFKAMIDTLTRIGSESNITLDGEGMTMMVSSGGTMAAKAVFKTDFFDEYTITQDKEEYGIFLTDFSRPLKKILTSVEISGDDDTMLIKSGNDEYQMPIVADVDGIKQLPTIAYSGATEMTFQNLFDAMDKVKIIDSDSVTFYAEDGKLNIRAKKGTRKASTQIQATTTLVGELYMTVNLLDNVTQKSNDKVILYLEKDKPFFLEYTQGSAALFCMVATRVDEGD